MLLISALISSTYHRQECGGGDGRFMCYMLVGTSARIGRYAIPESKSVWPAEISLNKQHINDLLKHFHQRTRCKKLILLITIPQAWLCIGQKIKLENNQQNPKYTLRKFCKCCDKHLHIQVLS